MGDDGATEFPCKYYSYPYKPKGVCLILKWTVENLSRLQRDKEYKFPPVRYLPLFDLEVSFVRNGMGNLYLYVESKAKNCINLYSTVNLCNYEGKQLYQEVNEDFVLNTKTDILPNFQSCEVLKSLPNDILFFDIKFEVFNLNNETAEKVNSKYYERDTEIKFSADMKNWVLEKLPEETILRTKDGQINANKAILCARSSVFRKMFDHPTSEQQKNIVDIDDVNGTTLKILVDFLYSGKAEFPKTELQPLKELYYAADKYGVQDLRKICAQIMLNMLTKESALGVLVMAHRHSDHYLKNECLVFIRTCIQEVMETESWVHLKASDLALVVEVLETCIKVSAAAAVQELF